MKNLKKYGNSPFNIAIIHGGPGAPGEVAPVAKELSKTRGVLEPLQTKASIDNQLDELKNVLLEHGNLPLTLIGYSWGAWLSFIFAAQNPLFVKKLILVGSGPFEASYATNIMNTRLSRLNNEDRATIEPLLKNLRDLTDKNNDETWNDVEKYFLKTDSYAPQAGQNNNTQFQYDIYKSIWKEASELRRSGKLLALGKKIKCPVVAIHGDYDPHPSEGVQKPLSNILEKFRFILLKNCGHKPWIEQQAHVEFYKILSNEL